MKFSNSQLLIVLSVILVSVIAFGCWLYFSKRGAWGTSDSGADIFSGKSYDDISKEYYFVGAGHPITVGGGFSTDSIEEVIDSVVIDSISCSDEDDSSCYTEDDDSDGYSNSSSKVFMNEQYVTMYLANQKFTNGSDIDIRIDGDCRIYIDGDYAGVIYVLRYTSTSALLRYSGGMYGEGRLRVLISHDRLLLVDPLDGTTWYQTR
jgi:hypothetical protein